MSPKTYRPCNIGVVQHSVHLSRSSEGMNETTLSTLQIKNELSAPVQRHPRVPLLRAPMAQDDFNYDGENRNKLTRKESECRVLSMTTREFQINPISPRPDLPSRVVSGVGVNFAHTLAPLLSSVTSHSPTKQCHISYRKLSGSSPRPQIFGSRAQIPLPPCSATLSLFLPPNVTVVTRSLNHHENRPQDVSVEGSQWTALETGRPLRTRRYKRALRAQAPRSGVSHHKSMRFNEPITRNDVGMGSGMDRLGQTRSGALAETLTSYGLILGCFLLTGCEALMPVALVGHHAGHLNVLVMGQSNALLMTPNGTRAFQESIGIQTTIVNCAVGGTPIRSWTATSPYVTACLSKMPKPDLLLWYQGESDGYDDGDYATWAQKFIALIITLRQQLGNIPVIYARISVEPVLWNFPHWQDVRDQQDSVVLANSKKIITDTIELREDSIHFTENGYKDLGRKFAQAYKELGDPS